MLATMHLLRNIQRQGCPLQLFVTFAVIFFGANLADAQVVMDRDVRYLFHPPNGTVPPKTPDVALSCLDEKQCTLEITLVHTDEWNRPLTRPITYDIFRIPVSRDDLIVPEDAVPKVLPKQRILNHYSLLENHWRTIDPDILPDDVVAIDDKLILPIADPTSPMNSDTVYAYSVAATTYDTPTTTTLLSSLRAVRKNATRNYGNEDNSQVNPSSSWVNTQTNTVSHFRLRTAIGMKPEGYLLRQNGKPAIAIVDTGWHKPTANIHDWARSVNFVPDANNHVDDQAMEDRSKHGTMIAELVASNNPYMLGVAPKANLIILKAREGATKTADKHLTSISDALRWLLHDSYHGVLHGDPVHIPKVVVLPWEIGEQFIAPWTDWRFLREKEIDGIDPEQGEGFLLEGKYKNDYTQEDIDIANVHAIIRQLSQHAVLVTPAGNGAKNTRGLRFPQASPHTLTVLGVETLHPDNTAHHSNVLPAINYKEYVLAAPFQATTNTYGLTEGTSVGAALVAGAAQLIFAHHHSKIKPHEVMDLFVDAADDVLNDAENPQKSRMKGFDVLSGFGRLNVAKMLGWFLNSENEFEVFNIFSISGYENNSPPAQFFRPGEKLFITIYALQRNDNVVQTFQRCSIDFPQSTIDPTQPLAGADPYRRYLPGEIAVTPSFEVIEVAKAHYGHTGQFENGEVTHAIVLDADKDDPKKSEPMVLRFGRHKQIFTFNIGNTGPTWWVDPHLGSDNPATADGSPVHPFKTVTKAIETVGKFRASTEEQTIYVNPGVSIENKIELVDNEHMNFDNITVTAGTALTPNIVEESQRTIHLSKGILIHGVKNVKFEGLNIEVPQESSATVEQSTNVILKKISYDGPTIEFDDSSTFIISDSNVKNPKKEAIRVQKEPSSGRKNVSNSTDPSATSTNFTGQIVNSSLIGGADVPSIVSNAGILHVDGSWLGFGDNRVQGNVVVSNPLDNYPDAPDPPTNLSVLVQALAHLNEHEHVVVTWKPPTHFANGARIEDPNQIHYDLYRFAGDAIDATYPFELEGGDGWLVRSLSTSELTLLSDGRVQFVEPHQESTRKSSSAKSVATQCMVHRYFVAATHNRKSSHLSDAADICIAEQSVCSQHCIDGDPCTRDVCNADGACVYPPLLEDNCPAPRGTVEFSTTNTDNATHNYIAQKITLAAGQVLRFGTCSMVGGWGRNSYVRLHYAANDHIVALKDDSAKYACPSNTLVTYTAPVTGEYENAGRMLSRSRLFRKNGL